MIKKTLILILSLLGTYTHATLTTEDCMDINMSVGVTMTNVLVDDLKIAHNELQLAKTQMVLLREEKVDYAFADYLAKQFIVQYDISLDQLDEYRRLALDDNARNLIIEFTYFNRQNKKAVFIGSALINDNECSVLSNGYIIVKREF